MIPPLAGEKMIAGGRDRVSIVDLYRSAPTNQCTVDLLLLFSGDYCPGFYLDFHVSQVYTNAPEQCCRSGVLP